MEHVANGLDGHFIYQYKVMCFIIILSSFAWLIYVIFSPTLILCCSYYYQLFSNAIFTSREFMILRKALISGLKCKLWLEYYSTMLAKNKF